MTALPDGLPQLPAAMRRALETPQQPQIRVVEEVTWPSFNYEFQAGRGADGGPLPALVITVPLSRDTGRQVRLPFGAAFFATFAEKAADFRDQLEQATKEGPDGEDV